MTMPINLTGKFLIALPGMGDHRFQQAVIYMCSHDRAGAMGIVINRQKNNYRLSDMLEMMGIEGNVQGQNLPVLDGGPVDIDRGFLLQTPDGDFKGNSLELSKTLRLTTTKDALESLAAEGAPTRAILAVGYSGWGAGQIEHELQQNAWITVDADEDLVFDPDMSTKWDRAIRKLGITPDMLAHSGGRA